MKRPRNNTKIIEDLEVARLKLECLKLATTLLVSNEEIIKRAEGFYFFLGLDVDDEPEKTDTEPAKKLSLLVEEDHGLNGPEWSLSLNGFNPEQEDSFTMSEETAFRLKDRLLAILPPGTFYSPLHNSPSNKISRVKNI